MSNGSPTVTVLIPTFNRSAWLRELVEIALDQTRPVDVVLVADNGSTDDTESVVRSFGSDGRVRYLRRPTNVDPIVNQNEALAQVETDYVTLVPDDDRIYRDFVRATAEILDAHPRVGVVHTSFDVIDSAGETVFGDIALVHSDGGTTFEKGADFVREQIANRWRIGFALSRTAALRSVGFLAEADRADWLMADMVMWMEVAVEWDVAHVPETLAGFRIHDESLTATRLSFSEQGYAMSRETADMYLAARSGFVRRRRDSLIDPDELLKLAERSWRRDRIQFISESTFPGRRRRTVVPELWSALRRDRRVVLEAGAWRLLATSLVGDRVLRQVRRARALVQRDA